MAKTITFNELRKIKDQLPSGSMRQIADKLDLNEETVRNYFGGRNFDKGQSVGIHFEQGPDGGIVTFDDTTILDLAKKDDQLLIQYLTACSKAKGSVFCFFFYHVMNLTVSTESAELQFKQILEEFFIKACRLLQLLSKLIIASYLHDIGMSVETGVKFCC